MRFLVLLGALALAAPAVAQTHTPSHGATAPTAPLSDTARVRRWREELRFIAEKVRTQHPRPFHRCPAASFDSAALAIERRIPTTDDLHLVTECMRMVAMIHDGHTVLLGTLPPLGFDSVLPALLRPFEDGLYVTAADSAHARMVGARVVRVGSMAADEAIARLATAIAADNRYTALDRVPFHFMIPGLLHGLGISPDRDRVTLEIERAGGAREKITVQGGAPPEGFPFAFFETEPRVPRGWASARRVAADRLPRCDRRPEDAWWFEYLADSRLVYLRLRRVEPIVGEKPNPENFRRFTLRVLAALDSLKPAAMVVDLRHDHGGNNTILDPLITGIVERPWLDREGGLFAIIDRGTFSAAMNCAVFLQDRTRATFVGEPTGGGLNSYGDAPEGKTPNFEMIFQVSTIPWLSRFPMDPSIWIAPEIATPTKFSEWRDGADPGLDAVLDAMKNGTRDQQLIAASRRGGPAAAVAALTEWNRKHPNPWSDEIARSLIIAMSKRMDRGASEEGAALGETLVRLEPREPMAWRFLGEAQLDAGNRARAVEALRETIRLNPQARIARAMLRSLGEEP
jgi:hypothetical protein